MAYYHRSSAAQRVRISVKDNAFGLIDEREKQFWVSFSTFLRPQSLLQRRNGDDKDVAVHAAIVSDLVHHLHSILNLGKGTSLSLSVDGYILPDNESLDVIHEMDVVHVDLKPCVSPCDNAMKKKNTEELPTSSETGKRATATCLMAPDFHESHTPSTATKCSRYRKRRRRSKSGSSPQKSVPLLPEDAACSSSSPYLHDLKSHGDSNHGKQQQPSCLFNSVTLQAKEPSNSLHQTSDSSLYQVEIHDEQTRSGKAVQWGGGAALAPPPTTELQVQEPPPCKKKRRRRKSKPENAGCNDLSQVNILEPGDQLQQSPVGLVIPPPAVSSLSIVKHLEGTNCCVPSSHNANVPHASTVERLLGKRHVKFDSDGEEDISIGCNNRVGEVIEEEDYTAAECGGSISDYPIIGQQNGHVGEEEQEDEMCYMVSPSWKRPYEVIASINQRNLVNTDDAQPKYPEAKDVSSIEELQVGDYIAYKVLELLEKTWSPVLSPFVEGTIVSFSPVTTTGQASTLVKVELFGGKGQVDVSVNSMSCIKLLSRKFMVECRHVAEDVT